jgi:hypothetical protein
MALTLTTQKQPFSIGSKVSGEGTLVQILGF